MQHLSLAVNEVIVGADTTTPVDVSGIHADTECTLIFECTHLIGTLRGAFEISADNFAPITASLPTFSITGKIDHTAPVRVSFKYPQQTSLPIGIASGKIRVNVLALDGAGAEAIYSSWIEENA